MIYYFFFNDTATTEIYTLSLHDALPICEVAADGPSPRPGRGGAESPPAGPDGGPRERARPAQRQRRAALLRRGRSEEHTSELQSRQYLVCRLLLEKKKKSAYMHTPRALV